MKASETKLQALIEGTKQYIVPLFQRAYSWDKKEWEMLWNDLMELYDTDNPRAHFIGSIVTMPTTSVPEGIAKYLLIDGQQRLTTIFILLALLRDKAKKNDQEELAEEINDTLLVNRYKKGSDYYKLQPTQVDRESFHNLIHSDTKQVQDKITGAYHFFDRKLKRNDIDGESLKKVISSNVSVVSIVLEQDDDPYLVFESLNAKGRPLTQSDLVRNYFFMKIHTKEQEDIYARYWEPMQTKLGDSLTECIRHYLMIDGAFVKQGDVYYFLKQRLLEGEPLKHLSDLTTFATYYHKLLDPKEEPDKNIQKALQRIRRFEITTSYPFLLNCYHDYHQNKLSANNFVKVLQILENFIIRRFVCNVTTNVLNKMFPALYIQIKSKNPTNFVDGLKSVLQTKGYPKDSEFKLRFMDSKFYGNGDRAVKTKLILEAIEESYNHKEQINFEGLTIEHIMPQMLTDQWKEQLGGDYEITHELLLHTIGNLTLTKYNPELSNHSFSSKKEHFKSSHIELNRYFTDLDSWKKEDIEKRSALLTDIALSIWPYFGNEEIEPNEQKRVTGTTPKTMNILGQRFEVQSWRDVLERTMNTIAELEPEKFGLIMNQFPRSVGRDKKKFNETRELSNGTFIEVQRSAKDIQRFCFQVLEAVELSSEDLQVETIKKLSAI
ncbi:DUF262 domain-containing protein [Dictyobacter kobayashii]|uniref:DUF262 domain-containing protein n=1 Tax=Dictyobacter kobayashii TaxID=2014872 RepID=A0A402AP60_9CHLR|nr:DUF262 domain-containing protein [Dictyobacter kobayashii]GCE20907.1 hypothetical protein KDK_47070 [Dictyobacter kobayashii]